MISFTIITSEFLLQHRTELAVRGQESVLHSGQMNVPSVFTWIRPECNGQSSDKNIRVQLEQYLENPWAVSRFFFKNQSPFLCIFCLHRMRKKPEIRYILYSYHIVPRTLYPASNCRQLHIAPRL